MRDVLADQGKSAGSSKNKHVYSYVHGDKAVHENLLLVTTDRFGPDGWV